MIKIFYKTRRPIAILLLFTFVLPLMNLNPAMALTSGPSQPEMQGFQPSGKTEMVNLFNGDFSYNIPLFELPGPNGGYPFNLSYQSGITMDQEASWVGLGFNINPGTINRQMRGLPDEFNGDVLTTTASVASNITYGVGLGVGFELFGADLGVSSIGVGVAENNYRGMSYNIDVDLGYGKSVQGGPTNKLGLDLSLDSKDGVGVSPSMSLGRSMGEFGVRAGYNSKTGLSSVSAEVSYRNNYKPEIKQNSWKSSPGGAGINFAHPGYTPQINLSMKNLSFAAKVKVGFGADGAFADGYIKGFYNVQSLNNDLKGLKTPAYGYLNYQNSTGSSDVLDINREKDGMVSKYVPNLPIPSLTSDIYSVSGQGIGSMYRPIRNDIGVVHDQEVSSSSIGGGGGIDLGVPLHQGLNLNINHSKSTSGKWSDDNSFISAGSQKFQTTKIGDSYEPWQFKVHGEHTTENQTMFQQLAGEAPVRVKIHKSFPTVTAQNALQSPTNPNIALPQPVRNQRKSRSNVIQSFTNGELLSGTNEVIPLFNVDYLDNTGVSKKYVRTAPKHHIAGLTALSPDGVRYVYAIPAYNTLQEEVSFTASKPLNASVNRVNTLNNRTASPTDVRPDFKYTGTEQFLKITQMPGYAHSYLLTSVVGPDYVDVTNNGVTSDDLGYWVKFTYQQMNSSTNPFVWRDPISKAHFQEGWKTDPRDDRGSYVYGEKELWYLSTAETKSHIATFKIRPRNDGFGAVQRLQDSTMIGKPVYQLYEIDLASRSARNNYKIKKVLFDYDYSLCQGIFNFHSTGAPNVGTGKLTLKKLSFQYGENNRGKLNPYLFSYSNSNPNYNLYAYDRWGTYKPYIDGDKLQNVDGPWALQDPSQKSQIDAYASSWNLSQIQLPSGGKVMVDYESDDYAYVQNIEATQMMELVDPYSPIGSLQPLYQLKDNDLKIRFALEKPISGSISSDQQKTEILKYLTTQGRQLGFKIKVNLRSAGEGFFEYIQGYADIDFNPSTMGLEQDATGKFAYGYFHVKAEGGYHPLSARAWQHIRTNQPDIANSGAKQKEATSNSDRIDQIKSLSSAGAQVVQMFQGFKTWCSKHGFGRQIESSKSWIRLSSPDQIKYGGGARVKQITITDQWAKDQEGVYGQTYDYTKIVGKDTISSGVAAYEPIVGGEENALHYAKNFTENVPLRSDNNLFFEFPINESYYPGPEVGYSKVTVKSLASASLAGEAVNNINIQGSNKKVFPQGSDVSFGTSGITINEFYTAKDFPVITAETDPEHEPISFNVIVPVIGTLVTNNLTSTQGYSIITNDMHGKEKRTTNLRLNTKGNSADTISWIQYNYRSEAAYSGTRRASAISTSNIFKDNLDGTLSSPTQQELNNPNIPKVIMGQETEVFTDMRQFEDNSFGAGANFNFDEIFILFGVLPIPSDWPNVSNNSARLRTSVTNKIIYKSGILASTRAYNEGSLITTTDVKWDKLTGTPILTEVNNNFDAPIYNYSIPAYSQYPGMGPAYQNTGITLYINDVEVVPYSNGRFTFTSNVPDSQFVVGDEILLYQSNSLTSPVCRAIYEGIDKGSKILSATTLLSGYYNGKVVRSGYRNQLSVMAGSIKALQDPSIQGTPVTYNRTVVVPTISIK